MGHSPPLPDRPSESTDTSLEALCRTIRTVDSNEARDLPAQILSYLAQNLTRMDIDIYVEECLPMVCNASHALVRALGTFSPRNADSTLVDNARLRLIQALETITDELQTCKSRARYVARTSSADSTVSLRAVR